MLGGLLVGVGIKGHTTICKDAKPCIWIASLGFHPNHHDTFTCGLFKGYLALTLGDNADGASDEFVVVVATVDFFFIAFEDDHCKVGFGVG